MRSEITPEDLFECQQCGQCCRGYGGTYITRTDIKNIAAYIGISEDELLLHHCTPSAGGYVLSQKDDGFCVFWDQLCTIHPVKPRMCWAWPFIENLLKNPESWNVMAEACPGMRTGFDKNDILRCVRKKLDKRDVMRNPPSESSADGKRS